MADEPNYTLDALFDVEPDWNTVWRGMPDYKHRNLQPWQTMLVHFTSLKDRQAFADLVGQNISHETKFIWYPKATIEKASDKVWTRGEKVVPRYPVYIISKGRWESRLTSKALEWIEVPYHIVVEPQEYEQYAAVIDPKKILVLPFSNLGQGGIPARNWVWEHSISVGAARHWILDDNISGFCRFQDNIKIEVDSGVTFKAAEDLVDRYENLVMAAFNYDYFAPRKQGTKIKPYTLNTRCYSGILLSNAIPHRWRGRYNEDTDLSLRILKDGYCTILFNAFLMYKKPTLTMKGGNTDELYKRTEEVAEQWALHVAECSTCKDVVTSPQCKVGKEILSQDGRWLMAESLREQHPDCVTVEWKWDRWQHQVDYRRFASNPLIVKPGVTLPEGVDNYGMTLGKMPAGWGAMAAADAEQTEEVDTLEYVEKTRRGRATAAPRMPSPISALAFLNLQAEPDPPPAQQLQAEPAQQLPAPPQPGPGSKVEAFASACTPALAEPSAPGQPEQPAVHRPEPEPESEEGATFAADLRRRGHHLLVRDGKFFVSNTSRLTDEDRQLIQRHRSALIACAEPWVGTPAATMMPTPPPTSLFAESRPFQSLASVLGAEPPRVNPDWRPDEPPDLSGVDKIVLNFATNGLDWRNGARPVGVTIGTLDGQLIRFLPFAFEGGGNLDYNVVKRWFSEQIRGKHITNANTRFELHMARAWGVDLEEHGNTFSDIMHTAALLDDHRKRFALDVLAADFLPGEDVVERVDETVHSEYAAWDVAARERYSVQLVTKLHAAMYPELEKQELLDVQALEDAVIPVVVEMEKNGSPLDIELLERFESECSRRHNELMREIADEVGFAFDHTAVGWKRMFERCGIPPSDSYAEEIIEDIDHPLIEKAHFAAQLASLNSKTFAAYKKQIGIDGILYYDINQLRGDDGGTVSGRFSIGYVQQVPNHDNHHRVFGTGDIDACLGRCDLFPRRLFRPGFGQYLNADAAQIEYRLFAHFANNPQVLAAYAADPWMSFHKMTWEMIKKVKPDQLYSHQKNFNFARMYGARSVKLAVMMGFISAAEGEEIRRAKRWNDPKLAQIHEIETAYKRVMPEVDSLLDYASHLAKSACDNYCKKDDLLHRKYPHRGFVKTMRGRRSRFPHNSKTYIGLNRVIQGTGADIMKMKLVELHRERKHTNFLMRLTVHDAVSGDAREPDTPQKLAEVLNQQSYPLKVPILWDVKVGSNWAEAK